MGRIGLISSFMNYDDCLYFNFSIGSCGIHDYPVHVKSFWNLTAGQL